MKVNSTSLFSCTITPDRYHYAVSGGKGGIKRICCPADGVGITPVGAVAASSRILSLALNRGGMMEKMKNPGTGNRHRRADLGGGGRDPAAIGARERGAQALLLSKGPLARSGASPMAGADFTLDGKSLSGLGQPGDPNDGPEKVMNDIVTQGWYLNNQRLVEHDVKSAPACLKELIDWGIQIKASDQRMIFTSGTGIMDALLKRARASGVRMMENVALLDLVVEDGAVVGGLGLDIMTGRFHPLLCQKRRMATGGLHKAVLPVQGTRDLPARESPCAPSGCRHREDVYSSRSAATSFWPRRSGGEHRPLHALSHLRRKADQQRGSGYPGAL